MSKLLDYAGLGHFKDKYDASVFGVKMNYIKSNYVKNDGTLYGGATTCLATDFIPVSKGDSVVWYHGFSSTSSDYCLCGYNANKEWISGQYWTCSATPSRTISSSNNNIAYIRATMNAESATTPYITVNGTKVWEMATPVTGAMNTIEDKVVDSMAVHVNTAAYSYRNYSITWSGIYGTSTTYKHKIIPVSKGEKYKIEAGTEYGSRYAFFTAIQSGTSGGACPLLTGTSVMPVNYGEYAVVTIPDGCVGLAFYCGSSPNYNYEPIISRLTATNEVSEDVIETEKMLNTSDPWTDVELTFGKLATGENTYGNESSTTRCVAEPIAAKRGDIFRGGWTMQGAGAAVYETSPELTGFSTLVMNPRSSNGYNEISFVVENDCYITPFFADTTIGSDAWLQVKHSNVPDIKGNVATSSLLEWLKLAGIRPVQNWRDGTYDNKANTNYVHCETINIPDGATYWAFVTSRTLPENYYYNLSYRYSDDNLNAKGTPVGFSADGSRSNSFYKCPDGATRLYLMLGQRSDTKSLIATRASDMMPYQSFVIFRNAYGNIIQTLASGFQAEPVVREIGKRGLLASACRYRYQTDSDKDPQFLLISDTHAESKSVQNAVTLTNYFGTIDGMVHCGDIVANYPTTTSQVTQFQSDIKACRKPVYIVAGNHDAGNWKNIAVSATHAQVYDMFIKPMVDAGTLVSGEYEENKPYWYHDISDRKVRLIGLYEYDQDLQFAESDYWEPVTYDSTAAKVQYSHTYAVGDVINCGIYTDYSFRCKAAVTTGANYYTNQEKVPCWKSVRSAQVYNQTQAQWFLDTLLSTPANYGVIIIKHYSFANEATNIGRYKFAQTSTTSGSDILWMNDLLADAVNAFVNGESFTFRAVMRDDVAYMNTLSDGQGSYAYTVSADFSQKNTGATFYAYLGGHWHRDLIFKHPTYPQYQVRVVSGITEAASIKNSDIRRQTNPSLYGYDALTVASFAPNRIALARLGVNETMNGEPRDYEVINTSTGETGDVTKKMFDEVSQMVGGAGSTRPSSPATGTVFFDTSVGKPIWWNGTAWVDATGTSV